MKSLAETLLLPGPFSEIVMGNTALVRAMMEAGVRSVSSYPGSPTPEIAEAIEALPQERRPFRFEFSTNEKVALEVAFGASLNGHLSVVFFKSVGLNVAADTFVQLSLMELTGGLVIVLGDDPGANSSQNEQDNRHFARMAYTPLLEPASPQESYDFFLRAALLSRKRRMPVILRLTTHVCHAKSRVNFATWTPQGSPGAPLFSPSRGPYIPLADSVFPLKRRALEKLRSLTEEEELVTLNRTFQNGNPSQGVITAGLPTLSLLDVLERSPKKPDILKLGLVHPLEEEKVASFLACHEEVKVLEELDDFLEQEIRALAQKRGLSVKILGKEDPEEWIGEYTPEKVGGILNRLWPEMVPEEPFSEARLPFPNRPPQLCPGCGHRSAFFAIKRALREEDITVADIGCHTLGSLPPYRVGQVLLCMGHSCGTAAGLSLFNESRRVVAFLGDSTLFHSGLPGIVNALFNKHNFTLVIMENGTTAMTGHQDHPGTGRNFAGPTERIPLRSLLEGLGVRSLREVDAYNQNELTKAMQEALSEEGFKVVIAKHPCMLKLTREQRRAGKKRKAFAVVDPEKCSSLRTCLREFGCPSFQETGERAEVHPDLCIGDGSCLSVCSAQALSLKGEPSPQEEKP